MQQADKFWKGKKEASVKPTDTTVVVDKPIRIDELQISFHEMFFDYYLRAPGQPDGYYVTDVAEQKVGFGSKYQLKKFLDELLTDRFSDGIISPGVIRVQPIPELSSPVVRRLGTKAFPVEDSALTDADHQKRLRGQHPGDYSDLGDGKTDTLQTIMIKPTQAF